VGRGSLTSMTTAAPSPHRHLDHRWLVSEDSAGLFPIRTGTAESAAPRSRPAAPPCSTVRSAISPSPSDDELPTLGYSPGRDRHGQLDSDHVAEDLARLLQDTLRDLPRDQSRLAGTVFAAGAGVAMPNLRPGSPTAGSVPAT
jgi:hypothetical protein